MYRETNRQLVFFFRAFFLHLLNLHDSETDRDEKEQAKRLPIMSINQAEILPLDHRRHQHQHDDYGHTDQVGLREVKLDTVTHFSHRTTSLLMKMAHKHTQMSIDRSIVFGLSHMFNRI